MNILKKIQTRGVHVYRVLVLFSFIKISPARAPNCIYLHFQMFFITLYWRDGVGDGDESTAVDKKVILYGRMDANLETHSKLKSWKSYPTLSLHYYKKKVP